MNENIANIALEINRGLAEKNAEQIFSNLVRFIEECEIKVEFKDIQKILSLTLAR